MPKGRKGISRGKIDHNIVCGCGRQFRGAKKTTNKRYNMHKKTHPECAENTLDSISDVTSQYSNNNNPTFNNNLTSEKFAECTLDKINSKTTLKK